MKTKKEKRKNNNFLCYITVLSKKYFLTVIAFMGNVI